MAFAPANRSSKNEMQIQYFSINNQCLQFLSGLQKPLRSAVVIHTLEHLYLSRIKSERKSFFGKVSLPFDFVYETWESEMPIDTFNLWNNYESFDQKCWCYGYLKWRDDKDETKMRASTHLREKSMAEKSYVSYVQHTTKKEIYFITCIPLPLRFLYTLFVSFSISSLEILELTLYQRKTSEWYLMKPLDGWSDASLKRTKRTYITDVNKVEGFYKSITSTDIGYVKGSFSSFLRPASMHPLRDFIRYHSKVLRWLSVSFKFSKPRLNIQKETNKVYKNLVDRGMHGSEPWRF